MIFSFSARVVHTSAILIPFKEIAENFKDQGNEYFKGKRYREAQGFYTQGIDARPTNPTMQEALLCNRAASNLELSMFDHASPCF